MNGHDRTTASLDASPETDQARFELIGAMTFHFVPSLDLI
jgi:hypothetical protein